jgi:hypothetical protein
MNDIVTRALQIAIAARKNGKTADEAKKVARNALWREYTPDSQAAAERAIDGLYKSRPVQKVA